MPTGNFYPTKVRSIIKIPKYSSMYSSPFHHIVVHINRYLNIIDIVLDNLLMFYLGKAISQFKNYKNIGADTMKLIPLKIYRISSILRYKFPHILTFLKGECVIQWMESHPLSFLIVHTIMGISYN